MITNVCSYEVCTGCGTCSGMCNEDAIIMRETNYGTYRPVVDFQKCTRCEMCIKVCPSVSSDYARLNESVFHKSAEDTLLGNYLNCYLGFSTDRLIRWKASSGGLVTTLLKFAFDERIIDGALVVRMSLSDPLKPEVLLARNTEEALSAMGSKYCPTPVNTLLKKVLAGEGRFAVVGLPCHIQGIRNAEILNNELREKVALHIGLFCAHTVDFRGTEFLLHKIGIEKENVLRVSYRGRGWPGGLAVKSKNGKRYFLPYSNYNIFRYFLFTPLACTLCRDGTAEFADISFGDPWLPEVLNEEKTGRSIIVSRSETGERILRDACTKNRIVIRHISARVVERSQREALFFKKKCLPAYIRILGMFKRDLPFYDQRTFSPDIMSYGGAIIPCVGTSLSSNRFFLRLLNRLPLSSLVACNKLISRVGRGIIRSSPYNGMDGQAPNEIPEEGCDLAVTPVVARKSNEKGLHELRKDVYTRRDEEEVKERLRKLGYL